MKQPTIRFQKRLIELLKGMLKAWDEWLDDMGGIDLKKKD